MSFSPVVSSSRREFFRAAGRYSFLTALGMIITVLGARRRLGGQRCINQGLCGGCAIFAKCGLPQALSAKAAKGEGKNESPGA